MATPEHFIKDVGMAQGDGRGVIGAEFVACYHAYFYNRVNNPRHTSVSTPSQPEICRSQPEICRSQPE
ncbi:MAG: hypothetical protein WCQ95_05165, partial [Bacteroidota bacterium]